jgi:tetratricopeptide (TPR) repeat protein
MMTMQTKSAPNPKSMETQVWAFIDEGKLKEAAACCEQMNRSYPEYDPGWRTASHLAQRLGKPGIALRAIDRALSLAPDNTEWKLQQASCLMSLGRVQDARPLLLELAAIQLGNGYQYATLGLLLSRIELHEQALEKYREASRLEPTESQHYYNLASVYRFLGDFTAAEESLARAIAINPADYDAYKLRADLRRQTPENNHVPELSALLDAGIDDVRGRIEVLHALAKELEDLGDYEQCWASLKQGADTRRRVMRYDVSGDIDTMARIREVYSAQMFQGHIQGDDNGEAIFILGMPRTGTTLVERILASHSQVHAAGELNNFALEMTRLARQAQQGQTSKTELVGLSATLDFAALGRAYIESTRPATLAAPRFLDKMPLNFLYAGLIHLALPGARILHLRRHPLDTCFAIYKTLFKDAYPFSYDLRELGRYYLAYQALMEHWHSVIPGVIRDVQYETLVSGIEEESRQLLDACDLDWEPRCLRFYENTQASTTASASQVREPAYTSSIGRWKKFEKQLQPLIDTLAAGGMILND